MTQTAIKDREFGPMPPSETACSATITD